MKKVLVFLAAVVLSSCAGFIPKIDYGPRVGSREYWKRADEKMLQNFRETMAIHTAYESKHGKIVTSPDPVEVIIVEGR